MSSVLIVDDEMEVRQMLKQMLEREGYIVNLAHNGEKAIEMFRENPTDLIITDIIMPEKEGIRTIFELKQEYPNVKIIAISGGGRVKPQSYLDTAKAFGALKTLKKPFDRNEILEAIKEVLEN